MAKYTIQHKCGHSEVHRLHGPHRIRAWRMERLANEFCSECYEAELERENAEAAAENKAMGLPELIGTEKQIAWAESIRFRFMRELDEAIEKHEADGKSITSEGQTLIETLMMQTEARFWIDYRDFSLERLLDELARRIKQGTVKPARSDEETKMALEAKAEATIRPAESKTDAVAEIKILGDTVCVEFPERNEDFRLLIRFDLRYSWTGSAWSRGKGLFGTARDRAAETGHRLLAAGFPIRIYDEKLRKRVLDADFEPEPKRVISVAYAGWFKFSWPRGEDFYDAAIRLPGARWDRPNIVVPADSFESVIGFAEAYGFALSPGALELVATAQAARDAELIAPPIEPKRSVKGRKPGRVPESLDVPEEVEVDDDLRDD